MAFRYPTGARPLLVEETARRKRLESRVVAMLEGAGFAEVVLPVIDFAELYADLADRDAARNSYRFVDRDGELISIRSDFTPMVARALAPTIEERDLPLRVFYRGDVVRCDPSRLGASREMFQIGAEIIGGDTTAIDDEVLRLAEDIATQLVPEPRVVRTDEEPSGYYTGFRFWIYADARRSPFVRGGRYDSLYARFGCDTPAAGFTFTIDELED